MSTSDKTKTNFLLKSQNFTNKIIKKLLTQDQLIEQDERYKYLIKFGEILFTDKNHHEILVILPQIPDTPIFYRSNQFRENDPKNLKLTNKQLSQIPLIEGEEKAENLFLNKNKIFNIENLVSLPELKFLDLSENVIEKLEDFGGVVNLEEIVMSGNLVRNFEGVKGLENLKRFSVGFNKLENLRGLDRFAGLEFLDVSGNCLEDLEGLGNLENLGVLKLSFNPLGDLEGVGKLEKLKVLEIKKLKLVDIKKLDVLKGLKNLREIVFEEDEVEFIEYCNRNLDQITKINGKIVIKDENPLNLFKNNNKIGKLVKMKIKEKEEKEEEEKNLEREKNEIIQEEKKNDITPRSLKRAKTPKLVKKSSSELLENTNELTKSLEKKQKNSKSLISETSKKSSNQNSPNSKKNKSANSTSQINSDSKDDSKEIIEKKLKDDKNPSESENSSKELEYITEESEIILRFQKAVKKLPPKSEKKKTKELKLIGTKNKIVGELTKLSPKHLLIKGDSFINFFENFQDFMLFEEITFQCVLVDNLIIKENRLKLEKMKKLKKLNFDFNNICDYLELINFENIPNLRVLKIFNNSVADCEMLRYFIFYRYSKIEVFNGFPKTAEELEKTKEIYLDFDKTLQKLHKINFKKRKLQNSDKQRVSKTVAESFITNMKNRHFTEKNFDRVFGSIIDNYIKSIL